MKKLKSQLFRRKMMKVTSKSELSGDKLKTSSKKS